MPKQEVIDKKYYRVCALPRNLPDFYEYGYADEHTFYRGLSRLNRLYRGRVGECCAERHVFLLLRFYDTIDGQPVEEWLPKMMCEPAAPPDDDEKQSGGLEEELDRIFGFE